ncbi:cytochrome c biogenesis protein ResB [Desulfonema ishimotonii]|uniref:Cytochrome c biogenesis protein ResB n=1 Tax=Desulfonema ishimotonii TaxID=45657 RepID=A0A401G432_9BACT|nr:cytochrome c biogenesis protein ResB [Desulfonema ishimotonii]GBC63997.1 cytochrome c biogenesis protein ResB [Desulfonema ishimotonii]
MKKGEDASVVWHIWEFLASIRLTIFVLLSLAATSVIGTLIPQNGAHADYLRKYGEFLFRIFYALDIFDMYNSWWFQLLMVILTVNIIICSADRLKGTWKIIFTKNPPFRFSRFQKARERETFSDDRPVQALRADYETYMARNFKYSRTEPTADGVCIFGERGRRTRLGVYIVHLSVVLLLLGGLVGSIFGFDGYVNIPEGESVSAVRLRGSNGIQPLDFEIRCDDFSVSFYKTGAPEEFRSDLVLLEDGREVYKKSIIVNDPIRYKGINIFQASYGTVPLDMQAVRSEGITLSFTSRETGMVYTRKGSVGKPVELPEGGGTFVLKDFTPSFKFMGQRDLGATFTGIITPADGDPKEIRLPIRFPRFDKMRREGKLIVSVTGYAERHYTGLQVTNDPGVPLVYLGAIAMILGCFVTFFMSHQQVCVELAGSSGSSRITVAGKANKNSIGMAKQVRRVARELSRL